MFCGDEDNGQLAVSTVWGEGEGGGLRVKAAPLSTHMRVCLPPQAWYLLSAMGLYALAPGTPDYVLGSPLFASMSIALPGGGTLQINGANNSAANVYVQGVTWNGAAVTGISLPYNALMQGGTLAFQLGPQPPTSSPEAAQSCGNAVGGQVLRGAGKCRTAGTAGGGGRRGRGGV